MIKLVPPTLPHLMTKCYNEGLLAGEKTITSHMTLFIANIQFF